MKYFGWIFIFMMTLTAHSQELLRLNYDHKSPDYLSLQLFLKQAEEFLPPHLKKQFKNPIEVHFKKIKSYGHTWGTNSIVLNTDLIPEILKGPDHSSPSLNPPEEGVRERTLRQHKTLYKEAQASVLHEVFHLYDFLNQHDSETLNYKQQCEIWKQTNPHSDAGEICDSYAGIRTTISTHPFYLDASGWHLHTNGGGRQTENFFKHRSPDRYELRSSIEHAAVNFEYFILDPEFKCRRPTLYRYFKNHFQVDPSNVECSKKLFFTNPSGFDDESKVYELDPDRVYGIHYLHAAPGKETMSKWGHSMVRVIVCAPGKPVGPSCMNDITHHLVFTYRAFINTLQMSHIKGLTGKYPSRLFIVPFLSVIDEYNKVELRDLKSLPIKMNRIQIRNFLEKAIETHWSYDGKYYFISNNCAVETFNLFKSVLSEPELYKNRVVTPDDLWRALTKSGLGQDQIFNDPNKAHSQRYLFYSSAKSYIQALSFLNKSEDFDKFLSLEFKERKKIYDLKDVLTREDIIRKYASIGILEAAASRIFLHKAFSRIQNELMKNQNLSVSSETQEDIRSIQEKLLKNFGAMSAPYELLRLDHYGLPNQNEIADVKAEMIRILSAQNKNLETVENLKDKLLTNHEKSEVQQSLDLQKYSTNLIVETVSDLSKALKKK